MALLSAAVMEPGVYFAINSPAAMHRHHGRERGERRSRAGASRSTRSQLETLTRQIGEHTLLSRTGGAPSLAVGMAEIFSQALGGEAVKALWYHFAIMFEALFILTTLDAGTRVGRFMVQDLLGNVYAPLGRTSSLPANVLASGADRRGLGLLPLPGRGRPARRHQLALAAVRHREPAARRDRARARDDDPDQVGRARASRIATLAAARLAALGDDDGGLARRSSHADRRIGFLAQAEHLAGQLASGAIPPEKLAETQILIFNNRLDAAVTGALHGCWSRSWCSTPRASGGGRCARGGGARGGAEAVRA